MNETKLKSNPAFFAAWGLSNVSSITEVIEGAVNLVFRVEAGSPVKTYYLRAYKTTDPAIIQREHDLIRHVQKADIPAMAPLFTSSGTTFVFQEDKYCALYPVADGVQVEKKNLTAHHARAAGKMLAQIHRSTQSLPDSGYRTYPLRWESSEWIDRLDQVINRIIARPHMSDQDQWALYRLKSQRAWLRNSDCPHQYKTQFPAQVLHGDYHEANLFFSGQEEDLKVSTVIDWDQAVYMPRGFELTRAASYMFDFGSAAALEFFKAYLTVNPMSREELEDGAQAWGAHADHYVWAVEEVYLHNNERARFFIPEAEFLPFATQWQKLRSRL